MKNILLECKFTQSAVDPCLFLCKYKNNWIYVAIYVNDNLVIGTEEGIAKLENHLKAKGLKLKVQDDLCDYLSCDIKISPDNKSAILRQPHLITNLEEKMGATVKNMRSYLTPGTPGQSIWKATKGEEIVSLDQHATYRSVVGMLLYLVKHSRPDIANAVQELSKVLDEPSATAYMEMLRLTKYVLETRYFGLKIQPSMQDDVWVLYVYSDSDYGGDKDSCISVGGYVLYVCGVPVSWSSRSQRTITLSSTEAEWIAASKAVKEVIFILQLLESMKINVKLPIFVNVDNIGAVFMANNKSMNSCTKHMDIRTKYVN